MKQLPTAEQGLQTFDFPIVQLKGLTIEEQNIRNVWMHRATQTGKSWQTKPRMKALSTKDSIHTESRDALMRSIGRIKLMDPYVVVNDDFIEYVFDTLVRLHPELTVDSAIWVLDQGTAGLFHMVTMNRIKTTKININTIAVWFNHGKANINAYQDSVHLYIDQYQRGFVAPLESYYFISPPSSKPKE